jgi:hypothetical protein
MTWFKVDDKLHDHRKARAAGAAAMGVWVLAGSWAADNLTDGFVPASLLGRWGRPRDATRLVEVGLWHADEQDGEKGWRFHEWHERQPSRAQKLAEREVRAEAGRIGGKASGRSRRQANAKQSASQVVEPPTRPDPTRPEETTTSRELTLHEAPRDDVEQICEHLAARIEGNTGKRPTITAKWRTAARLMLDQDKRSEDDVHAAIDWCQSNEFWRANVLSLPKLREKFDQLRLQAQRQPGSGSTSRNEEWRAMQQRQMDRAIKREKEMGLR